MFMRLIDAGHALFCIASMSDVLQFTEKTILKNQKTRRIFENIKALKPGRMNDET